MADLVLLHAPAFFDFRDRDDILFPFLSTSGDVPITPLYEYFPVGFKSLERFLGERGHRVRIVNLASTLLRHPELDVERLLGAFEPHAFGIDLHWMVHVQGSLAIAALLKKVHPTIPVLFGGISSTYYADELIRYPQIDMVMMGYDTHAPMALLMEELAGSRRLERVPNLLWKSRGGAVRNNGLHHQPDSFSCGIDWSVGPTSSRAGGGLPILELLSTQNAGCAYNCGWCGGSRDAFRRVMKRHRAMARKPLEEVTYELASAGALPGHERYHFYSVGTYNETPARLRHLVERIGEAGFGSVSYEQFDLTEPSVLEAMVRANPHTSITLSPESHDMHISRLAGRGRYTMEEMEAWIERALDAGIAQVDVWFFVGMPEQSRQSVFETVEYSRHLLERFEGRRVMPLLCPMIPFLDPASTFFEQPDEHGYRRFFRTVEDHRRGMENASLIRRVNYETRLLDRRSLVVTGYEAVARLFEHRGELGSLPMGVAASVSERIADSLAFLLEVDRAASAADPRERAVALAPLAGEIARRNREVFFDGVANQAFPLNREIGGRWFDEIPAEAAAQAARAIE